MSGPIKADLGGVAGRLFEGFLAPLVLGGPMEPARPIGGRAALAVGQDRVVPDSELASHVQLGRCRVARKLAPLDCLPPPTVAEWALGAVLHDIVQAKPPGAPRRFPQEAARTHPRARGGHARARRVPLERGRGAVPAPWFSRMFEIQRTDTVIKWWVGSETFLGTTPPSRRARGPSCAA